jgi:hypothetical protein
MKIYKNILTALLLSQGGGLFAQGQILAEFDDSKEPEVFHISPASEERQMGRFFDGTLKTDQPGNAAAHYYKALLIFKDREQDPEIDEKVSNWVSNGLEKEEVDEALALVDERRLEINEIIRASEIGPCDWDHPIREEGFGLLLPHLSGLKGLSKWLLLDARIAAAQENYESSLESLGALFRMSQHIAEGGTLIEGLVAIAITSMALNQMESLIQQPGCPSLYWSLTELPSPFLDVKKSMKWEMMAEMFFDSTELRKGPQSFSLEKWRNTINQFVMQTNGAVPMPFQTEWAATSVGLMNYPFAKKHLVEIGFSKEEVNAMPVPEALLRHAWDEITYTRDQRIKWYSLPYWQSYKALYELEEGMQNEFDGDLFGVMNRLLIPALTKAQQKFVKLDQKIAMLRAIEACRIQLNISRDDPFGAWPVAPVHFAAPVDPGTGMPILVREKDGATELQTFFPYPDKAAETRLIRIIERSE